MSVSIGGHVVKSPDYDSVDEVVIPHFFGYSASGKLYRYKKGIKHIIVTLKWSELVQEDKEDIENAFDGADAVLTTFTYKPTSGVIDDIVSVKFIEDTLIFTEIFDLKDADTTYTVNGVELPSTTRTCSHWSAEVKFIIV